MGEGDLEDWLDRLARCDAHICRCVLCPVSSSIWGRTELWWVFSLKKVVCVETVLGAADVLEDILGPQMENSTNGMSSITTDVILLIINCCILKELVRKYDSERK